MKPTPGLPAGAFGLHRLCVPRRVSEAVDLEARGVPIEGFSLLPEAADALMSYVETVRAA